MNGFYLYQNINDFQHTFLSGMAYSPVLALIDVYVSLKSLCTSWRNREKKKHIICKKYRFYTIHIITDHITMSILCRKSKYDQTANQNWVQQSKKKANWLSIGYWKKSSNLHTWLWEWERIWDPIKIENHIRCDNTHSLLLAIIQAWIFRIWLGIIWGLNLWEMPIYQPKLHVF